jgi:hypothetical protein
LNGRDGANYATEIVGLKVTDPLEGPQAAGELHVTRGATAGSHRGRRWPDVIGVLWVVGAACIALLPTLLRGSYFGAFDFIHTYGLLQQPVLLHNAALSDQNNEIAPWITLAWNQVHQGHLPIWTSHEALGMPLAFNFGSGAFSFPALISYLTPVRVVYWVQVLVSLIVGGTGAYFFGRVLRLHPIACAFAGTTWVLSGPFFGYLGLPDTSVTSWAGWQFAAALLILRGTHRYWSVVLLAVTFAFSILAGNPQIEILILLALGVFLIVVLVCRTGILGAGGPIRRPVVDLVLALVAGGALSAPLALPGLQLAAASARNVAPNGTANPISQPLGLIFQTFWGQPIYGSFINPQGFYPEQWVWVGAIAVVLAVVAVALRWRQPAVVALAAAVVVTMAASVLQPVDSLLNQLPLVGRSYWLRSLIPLALCVAMLAGVGFDAVLRQSERRRAIRWALATFGVVAVALVLLWLFARGTLPGYAAHARAESFVWPAVSTLVGLVLFGALLLFVRRGSDIHTHQGLSKWLVPGFAVALLIVQTVFLVILDGPLPSSSSTPYPKDANVVALQRAVGTSLVGMGNNSDYGGLDLGLDPNTNISYGINELAEYDPIAPEDWFTAWRKANASSPGPISLFEFVPGINDATVARRYGVSYVLEPAGSRLPGGVFVRGIGKEDLYRVPGASSATVVPATSSDEWPAVDAHGQAVPLTWSTPSKARIETDSPTGQVLRLRVASLPGWHATIDGRPLPLSPYLTMMLQAHIPSGHHDIELQYWPNRFTQGLFIAAFTVVLFVVVGVIARRRSVDRPSDTNSVD